MKYMLASFLLTILPPTRFFSVKRDLLRALGLDIGEGSRICGGVKFFGAGRISIGRNCWIGLNCHFYTSVGADVLINDRCDIAPEVSFMCGTHHLGEASRRAGAGRAASIRVGSGSWIGIGSTLLGGATVGESSVVGAHSLLIDREYPKNSLLLGSPAKVVRDLP